jgi:hypothetical protein
VCEREMQCGSIDITTPHNRNKTTVIAYSVETFISDERDDCTWYYLHG